MAVRWMRLMRQDDGGIPGQGAAPARQVVWDESAWTTGTTGRDAGCRDVAGV